MLCVWHGICKLFGTIFHNLEFYLVKIKELQQWLQLFYFVFIWYKSVYLLRMFN